MSFTIFDKFLPVLERIPGEAERNAVAMAVIRYGLLKEEPELGWPYDAIFEGMRDDIDHSREARVNNKGGRPKGSRIKPKPAPKPAPEPPQEPSGEFSGEVFPEDKNGGFENQKPPFPEDGTPVSETGNPEQYRTVQDSTEQEEPPLPPLGGEGAEDDPGCDPYALQCLAALNEVMGTAYGGLPPSVAGYLSRQAGRYPVEEVRAMVEFKRDEWEGTRWRKCLTPNTLFGAEHFEQYLAQSKMPREDDGEEEGHVDLGEYAKQADDGLF